MRDVCPNPSPRFIFTQNSFQRGWGSKIIFSTKSVSEIEARTVAFIVSLVVGAVKSPKVTHGAAYWLWWLILRNSYGPMSRISGRPRTFERWALVLGLRLPLPDEGQSMPANLVPCSEILAPVGLINCRFKKTVKPFVAVVVVGLHQQKFPSKKRPVDFWGGAGSSNHFAVMGGLCFEHLVPYGQSWCRIFYEDMPFRGSVFHGKNQHIGKIAPRCGNAGQVSRIRHGQ